MSNIKTIHPVNLELIGLPANSKKAYSFEECLPYIDNEIIKRRSRWLLNRISYMDYDDVSQIIRSHIFRKWEKWDQSQPLPNWVNAVISHQTRNIIRNIYTSYVRPCVQCPANEGGDLCRIYGKQCSECPVYKNWEKAKAKKHAIELAESFEEVEETLKSKLTTHKDLNYTAEQLHQWILPRLTNIQRKVYTLLFIDNLEEIEVAKRCGYRTSEAKRSAGYKAIEKMKKIFVKVAKVVMEEKGI